MSQNIIDTGQAANDGTGEPLRQAFTAINNNFSQIWSSGPVNSNVQITDNRILTLQTNQNLILSPNGIGDVQANTNIVPDIDHVRDIGNVTNRWDTVWAYYVDAQNLNAAGDLSVGGNLVVAGNIIESGNIVTDTLTIQLANTAQTTTAANGAGITVGANDNIATLLYDSTNNVWTTNIGITSNGDITANYFIGDGSLLSNINAGNIDLANITGDIGTSGNISGAYISGDGSQLTNIDANNINGLATVAYTGSYNDLIDTPDFGNLTVDISTTGNITGNYIVGDGSQLSNITGANIVGNISVNGNVTSNYGIFSGGNTVINSGISTTGDVTANAFAGDGSQISNITGANIVGDISITGNVTANYFVGNGSQLSNITGANVDGLANVAYTGDYNDLLNIPAPYDNANVIALLADFGSNTIVTSGNIQSGNIVPGANNYYILGNATNAWGEIYTTTAVIGTIAGNVSLGSNWINQLSDPVEPQDAATKNYVDTVAQGLHIHPAVYLATTSDLATYTGATVTYSQPAGYANGVGATLSLTGNTLNSLDGVSLVGSGSNTRLLIKNEGNAVYNGIYNYTSNVVLTRSDDADAPGQLDGGDFVFVQTGNTQADTGWAQTTDNVVIGTSNVVFTQFSGAGTYQAGNGLTLSGTVFSVNVDNDTTQIVTGNVAVKNVPVANVTGLDSLLASYTSDISTTGNIAGGYVIASGGNTIINSGISTTGDVTANVFIGNGSQLTGLVSNKIFNGTSYANIDALNGNLVISADGNAWTFDTSGNLTLPSNSSNINYANGVSILDGIGLTQLIQSNTAPASPTADTLWWDEVSGRLYIYYNDGATSNWIDASPAAVQRDYAAGNNLVLTGNVFSLANNISVTGNVTANAFVGDGSQLTGVSNPTMGAAQITPPTPVTSSVTVPANSANVNITTDTIFVTNSFVNGQAVTYNANGGTVMGGLGDGRIYYIGNATGSSFQLYDNAKNALLGGSAGRKNISGLGNNLQTFGTSATSIIVNYNSDGGNTVFVQSATANTVTVINGDFDTSIGSNQALRLKLFISGSANDTDFTATSVNGAPATGFTLTNGIKRNVVTNINVTIVNFGGTFTIYNG